MLGNQEAVTSSSSGNGATSGNLSQELPGRAPRSRLALVGSTLLSGLRSAPPTSAHDPEALDSARRALAGGQVVMPGR